VPYNFVLLWFLRIHVISFYQYTFCLSFSCIFDQGRNDQDHMILDIHVPNHG